MDLKDIKNIRFKGRRFENEDFSNCVLVGIDFSGSTLHRCNFNGSDLSHARFDGADLYRSSFRRTVLYATHFREANLTRCDFSEAFLYGVHFAGYSNITYAKFENFRLETSRRRSELSQSPGSGTVLEPGTKLEPGREPANFWANGYSIVFDAFENGRTFCWIPNSHLEREMQTSQVFNRLKRLYLANSFAEEARTCLYAERYHRRRSLYLHYSSPWRRERTDDLLQPVQRVVRSALALAYEFSAGYGLRPVVVVRNMVALYLLYLATALVLCHWTKSGVMYEVVSVERGSGGAARPAIAYDVLFDGPFAFWDLVRLAYFCMFSMMSFTFEHFIPYGHLAWLSSVASLLGLGLFALLISAAFSVMRAD